MASTTSNWPGAGVFAFSLLFALLFGALAYGRAAAFRRRFGRNPWGIAPGVWLLIGFLFSAFGLVLTLLACATTRVGPLSTLTGPPPLETPEPDGGPRTPESWDAATPESSEGTDRRGQEGDRGRQPPQATPGGSTEEAPRWPPAGWYSDPTGLHEYRFWEGSDWSSYVSDHGNVATDPLPPPPPRPQQAAASPDEGEQR